MNRFCSVVNINSFPVEPLSVMLRKNIEVIHYGVGLLGSEVNEADCHVG